MRTFTLDLSCAMGAAELWEFKHDFELERAAALSKGRVLELKGETRGLDVDNNVTVTRTFRCTFSTNPIPPSLRRIVDSSKVDSEVEVHWRPHAWDASHPCHTVIRMLHFEKMVDISSTQWLIERTASACTICARVHVDCRAIGVGGIVESAIENAIRKALEAFPMRAVAHKNGIEAEARPTPVASPILLMADRAPPLPRKFKTPQSQSQSQSQRWRLRLGPLRRAPRRAKSARVSDQEDDDDRHTTDHRKSLVQRLAQLVACSGCGVVELEDLRELESRSVAATVVAPVHFAEQVGE